MVTSAMVIPEMSFFHNLKFYTMKKITSMSFCILILVGCNSKANNEKFQKDLSEKTFTTTSYNYTKYNLYSIAFKEISRPLRIDKAPSGGSVFFRNSSNLKLDNGDNVTYSSDNCCFIWGKPLEKPMRVKVVWSVVFDLSSFDGYNRDEYDAKNSKMSAPGSRWCQAIVDIMPTDGPERPTTVILHFLSDGTVQANMGTFKTAAPLSAEKIKSHSTPLPSGTFCAQEIENPFYGIAREPHRE
jgi:hypothetical protein